MRLILALMCVKQQHWLSQSVTSELSPILHAMSRVAHNIFSLDTSHLPSLISIISTLLRDRSPVSIGSVAVAFEEVCSTRLDLLHQQYRRLCRLLVDVDEWGQVDLLSLLLRYARTMLARPVVSPEGNEEVDQDVQLLYRSAEPLFQSRNPAVSSV